MFTDGGAGNYGSGGHCCVYSSVTTFPCDTCHPTHLSTGFLLLQRDPQVRVIVWGVGTGHCLFFNCAVCIITIQVLST